MHTEPAGQARSAHHWTAGRLVPPLQPIRGNFQIKPGIAKCALPPRLPAAPKEVASPGPSLSRTVTLKPFSTSARAQQIPTIPAPITLLDPQHPLSLRWRDLPELILAACSAGA
jgi:hypothetical protein